MTNHKTPIRIIKRGQRQGENRSAEAQQQDGAAARQSVRDAAGNVASWVKEFKERRPVDPRKAFANLFGETAATLRPTA
ncbi:MAG TPA: hypothetical protein VM934_05355 [Pyrinomonadaceae bacterium]|jgi:hypothetical protein|nr:hypothetical protein [Pyrinomonadaceae bacterium]